MARQHRETTRRDLSRLLFHIDLDSSFRWILGILRLSLGRAVEIICSAICHSIDVVTDEHYLNLAFYSGSVSTSKSLVGIVRREKIKKAGFSPRFNPSTL